MPGPRSRGLSAGLVAGHASCTRTRADYKVCRKALRRRGIIARIARRGIYVGIEPRSATPPRPARG